MKRFSLRVLIALLILLLAAISCQHEDEKSDGPVFVTVKVQLNSRNQSMGPNYVISSGVLSAFVSAVPDSFYPFTQSTDLGDGYDAQVFNLTSRTVTLTVPLDTPLRLAKATYSTDLSLTAMLSGATQPSYLGASDTFTVTAGTTTLTVEVAMELIAESSIIGGTNQSTALSLSGNSSWFAGSGGTTSATPGTGTAAEIPYPYGITTDGTYFYVTDSIRCVIYRINISTSVVEIIAGTDGNCMGADDNSVGTLATFDMPTGITYLSEPSGDVLYITDQLNHTIRRIKLSGTFEVSTVAGLLNTADYVDDPTGTDARFNTPYGIVADRSGDFLYVADQLNHAIRKISTTFPNAVTNLAGADDGTTSGSTNAAGTAARFDGPTDVMIVGDFLYATDKNNGLVRKIDITTRAVTTFGGGSYSAPRGLSTDGTNLYVSNTGSWQIYIVPLATGTPTVLSGWGSPGCTQGPQATAAFTTLKGLVSDGNALYGADNGCARIFRID